MLARVILKRVAPIEGSGLAPLILYPTICIPRRVNEVLTQFTEQSFGCRFVAILLGDFSERGIMLRRQLLSRLPRVLGLSLLGLGAATAQETPTRKPLKIMMKSAWGSDDPTRGSFVFAHGLALADAGHEVQIFLTGEATYLMRKATVATIFPVGWPPLSETLDKVVAKHIPVFS